STPAEKSGGWGCDLRRASGLWPQSRFPLGAAVSITPFRHGEGAEALLPVVGQSSVLDLGGSWESTIAFSGGGAFPIVGGGASLTTARRRSRSKIELAVLGSDQSWPSPEVVLLVSQQVPCQHGELAGQRHGSDLASAAGADPVEESVQRSWRPSHRPGSLDQHAPGMRAAAPGDVEAGPGRFPARQLEATPVATTRGHDCRTGRWRGSR